jgi:tyrosyl-tRNA synthetase
MFVLTTKLLEDSSGRKMGKTEGNIITLSDSADDMFGKIMGWPYNMIALGFEICTDIKMNDVEKITKKNPRDAKMRLAFEIVRIYHGEKEAKKAQEKFIKLFQKREIPEDVKRIRVKTGEGLGDILVDNKIIPSKSEFRRLVKAGAIDIDNQTINNVNYFVKQSIVVKVGKKKFIRIVI